MKREGNLWHQIISFENLLQAARKAQKGKRFKSDVLEFNYHLETELLQLQVELAAKTYLPREYLTFKIVDPKPRFISAAPYRDRVVHHALCNVISPIFEKFFISDSYANRVDFGTHKALKKFTHLARTSRYVLQGDISKYFPSIDHEILKQLIQRKIKCLDTLWLIEKIIDYSNPQELTIEYFPEDCLLTPIERRKGLPLGNLTSQLFANIYLNQLDQFIKSDLRIKKYVRYVDDFALFSDSHTDLADAKFAITEFLISLRLKVHPKKTQLFATSYGANFVGFRILPYQIRIRADNLQRGRRRLQLQKRALATGKIRLDDVVNSLRSWQAHLAHGDTWRWQNLFLNPQSKRATTVGLPQTNNNIP